ncbi:uncharacterized protein MONOS_11612 [Monocercomonoides exilis]|uniref:uncharacterized protein n=1 Tax=Monocercomonoides exilis TaxID=2049356 RepID=UPI003559AC4E|nr:hypothetical protein MONOS_11612 [Monocercomonoides exilis]|eukprot:MONOS_11612.1-p1 / transcript=MONOS_11612.1 / gene=MONOS_11612 / organism=Monocercomonoides_exilis_PA203 / gene_product=unspecified product / transcript_product=unspecified product / location=Mono_scaffold00592:17347-18168(-) / protein_length=225 / sequence_SO=supercontig / SO=protein_coding / is_pseudo=false
MSQADHSTYLSDHSATNEKKVASKATIRDLTIENSAPDEGTKFHLDVLDEDQPAVRSKTAPVSKRKYAHTKAVQHPAIVEVQTTPGTQKKRLFDSLTPTGSHDSRAKTASASMRQTRTSSSSLTPSSSISSSSTSSSTPKTLSSIATSGSATGPIPSGPTSTASVKKISSSERQKATLEASFGLNVSSSSKTEKETVQSKESDSKDENVVDENDLLGLMDSLSV